MQCPKCQKTIPDGSPYCKYCGSRTDAQPSTPAPNPQDGSTWHRPVYGGGTTQPREYLQPSQAPQNASYDSYANGMGANSAAPNYGTPNYNANSAYGANAPQGFAGSGYNQGRYGQNSSYQQGRRNAGSPLPPKKKSPWKAIGITAGCLIAAVALWIGAGFIFPDTVWLPEPLASMASGKSESDGEIVYRPVNKTYTVLLNQYGRVAPFSTEENTVLYPSGTKVTIVELGEKEGSKEVYGRTGDDWLLIDNGSTHYLRLEEATSLLEPADKEAAIAPGDSQPDILKPEASKPEAPAQNDIAAGSESAPAPNIQDIAPAPDPALPKTVIEDRQLAIRSAVRSKSNYSGPACANMILDYFSVSTNQRELGAELKTDTAGVTEYRLLASVINSHLDKKSNVTYYPVYVETKDFNPVMDPAMDRIYDCIKGGCPTTAVLNDPQLTHSDHAIFVVIYGYVDYSDGSRAFYIYPPTESGTPLLVDEDQLVDAMERSGFICYLY